MNTKALIVHDCAVLIGMPYCISMYEHHAEIKLLTDIYVPITCTSDAYIAEQLRELQFDKVKVSGLGNWRQEENGDWNVIDCHIDEFSALNKLTLCETVSRIRDASIKWPEDVLKKIRDIEEK